MAESDDAMNISATRALGIKCPRCWRVVREIATQDDFSGAVRLIHPDKRETAKTLRM